MKNLVFFLVVKNFLHGSRCVPQFARNLQTHKTLFFLVMLNGFQSCSPSEGLQMFLTSQA